MYRLICSLFFICTFAFSVQNLNDLDNDLVPNDKDLCQNTPEAVFVTKDGCTKKLERVVYFEHASAELDEQYYVVLKETARLINELVGYKVELSGHTDSTADFYTNMKLSKERAVLVENILLENSVDKTKISTSWYGETMPVSTNISAEGRSENRRVNIILK